MEVVSRDIEISSRTDEIKLTFIGDPHFGGVDCDKKLFRACVNKIKADPMHHWIGMGDWGEFINYTDKRFDPSGLDPEILTNFADLSDLPKVQSNYVANKLLPIKSTCLGLLEGNHDAKIELKYHQRIHQNLCLQLQHNEWDLDLGYSAIIRLRIKRGTSTRIVKIYVHHGAGGGRKKGAKVNRVQDLAISFPNCQIYCMGHVHDRIAFVDAALDIRCKSDELCDIHRAFGVTGTFKKTYQQHQRGYGEKAQYPATSLGCISFILKMYDEGVHIAAYCDTSGLPA